MSPHEGTLHEFTATSLDGKDIKLSEYKGQVALVVNTASRCGLTPQYKGLEALYDKYKDRKFVVLGFPSNNFGNQEPGTNEQIAEFCEVNYGVSFPMFSKIDVNGPTATRSTNGSSATPTTKTSNGTSASSSLTAKAKSSSGSAPASTPTTPS